MASDGARVAKVALTLIGGMTLLAGAAFAGEADFVDVAKVAPHIRFDLRYATTNNFTHQVVYPTARCLLRRTVAERLRQVDEALAARGWGLALWDCYRPTSVQKRFFALVPDPRYVADPQRGSQHNRGAAVDVTLTDAHGRELDLGTEFDDFSPRAHRHATGLSAAARAHRKILDEAMAQAGFVGLPTEWWHFAAGNVEAYPFADVTLDGRY